MQLTQNVVYLFCYKQYPFLVFCYLSWIIYHGDEEQVIYWTIYRLPKSVPFLSHPMKSNELVSFQENPCNHLFFHATFKMRGNISQTVVKCHNLICKHHLGSCSSFQSSMCWVGSTSESYKTKKQRCFLFAVCYFLSILNNPHNLILVQTFRNKFQTSEIVTYVYQYWTMLANFI